jgi:argininosuccinate synthase
MTKKKVVLAYSGGLDTSYCVKYLTDEKGYEVHSILVDTGGFSAEELEKVERRAHDFGVASHKTYRATDEFYNDCIKYLIFGNVLRNNTYPLSVSAERVFQAKAIAQYAEELNADAVAHGSTGAGNDQVRFDMIFHIMIPGKEIITPIRDMKLSREQEINYLKSKGVEMDWSKAQYSINQGIWGTSVGGRETLTSHQALPDDAYPSPCTRNDALNVTLHFHKGELKGIDDKQYANPVEAIAALNRLGSAFGIGRDIHVGDTIIGIKGRVGFEAPGPLMIIKAHHQLEKHVLSKWQQYWKEQLANWYGMLVHEGQFLEPVMRNTEKFLTDTQERVSGEVYLRLSAYRFTVQGIKSPFDMMSSRFGAYGEMNAGWSGDDVKGFSKMLSNQVMIYNQIGKEQGHD